MVRSPQYWTKLLKAKPALAKKFEPRLNHYIPREPTIKQTAFLLLDCEEAFYGGAGGGGKSEALLMAALQYADVKGYIAGLFRRNLSECYQPGGLVDLSHEYLLETKAHWNGFRHRWTFPEGSILQFGGMKELEAVKKHKGAYYQYEGFDELTEFARGQYMFMFSRLRRRVGVEVPLRMRGGSNPGGEGHIWVKRRMIDGRGRRNRIYIPARLEDNPHIDQEAYNRSLTHLSPVLQAQIRRGDWTVSEGGKVFKREWFTIQKVMPAECRRAVRYWDLAATEATKGRDPDYTCGLLMSTNGEKYFIGHVLRFRGTPGRVENLVDQRAKLDEQRWGRRLTYWFEQEPGSSGKHVARDYRRLLSGIHVRFDRKTSSESKLLRANPFASQAEGGNVVLIEGPWNEDFLDELESFPDGPHDDQVDGASGAYDKLRRRQGRDVVSWLERATPLPQRRRMAR